MCESYSQKEFMEPWYYIESNGMLESELYKEVGPGHILFGKKLLAIARRDDQDDVLFCFVESPSTLATVHLTWKGGQESDPIWPIANIFNNWEEWVRDCMIPDNAEFNL